LLKCISRTQTTILLIYKLLHLGPLTRLAEVSGRRTFRSTATNHLDVPPFKKKVNYRQPSFSGCRHQDLESTDWRCRLSIIRRL